MKALLFTIVILLPLQVAVAQNKYSTTKGYVSFYSKAPIADVDAKNEKVKVDLNTSNGEITFDIAMSDFKFESEKMGRDARKKYLETEKFPKAGFKGKIEGKVDYDKPGSYKAKATGKLKVHGVEKDISEEGTVTVVAGGRIKVQSEFRVALKDYGIETPEILGKEMTDDMVLVKVEATLNKGAQESASRKQNE